MLKFDEQKQIDSVKGALALRGKIEEIVDQICKDGFKNICWLGIGGTYASCLQAEVHMKEKSGLDFFVENAAEYLTTGNKKVGADTIVVVSSEPEVPSRWWKVLKKLLQREQRCLDLLMWILQNWRRS